MYKIKIRMENIMRQFKFRAWEMNKMYYQVRCGGVFDDIPTAPTVWNDERGDWLNMTGQPDTVIMQWTGHTNKNGVEIYEGDILEGRRKYIVEWNEDKSMFVLRSQGFPDGEELYTYDLDNMNILGNIFESPELFEENKWWE